MNKMFYGYSSLLSLPDISIWNSTNAKIMEGMISECSSLLSDISNWNTTKAKD